MRTPSIVAIGTVFAGICIYVATTDARIHTVAFGDGQVRYKLAGEGAPAVVLESGWGAGFEPFDPIYDAIAAQTQVFAYDRPGYDGSTPTARPRSTPQIADDLHELLALAAVEPPYVLAGYSLGGIYVIEFAHRYPADTAGIVLIDVPHPELVERLRELDVDLALPEVDYQTLPDNMRREWDGFENATMPDTFTLGDLPLIVLSSGGSLKSAIGPMVQKTHEELARLSTNGRQVTATESAHRIADDNPKLVIESILEVADNARGR